MKSNSNSGCYESIDVTGLCKSSDVSAVIKDYPYWIQMYLPETLIIPEQKPDVEVINSVNISVNILRNEVIKTPDVTGYNLEGKTLSGRKLIVEGELCQKVVYTADLPDQPVHSAHFYVPFSAYIVVPKEYSFNGTVVDSLDINYDVNVCIEDLSVSLIDPRTVLKRVTFLLYAVPNQSF